MAEYIKYKQVIHARLLKDYASWIYCDKCNNTIGYLCYVTYQQFQFHFNCQCGNNGSIVIEKGETNKQVKISDDELIMIKNRLCCAEDQTPLVTILEDKLKSYTCEITCKMCGKLYKKEG